MKRIGVIQLCLSDIFFKPVCRRVVVPKPCAPFRHVRAVSGKGVTRCREFVVVLHFSDNAQKRFVDRQSQPAARLVGIDMNDAAFKIQIFPLHVENFIAAARGV